MSDRLMQEVMYTLYGGLRQCSRQNEKASESGLGFDNCTIQRSGTRVRQAMKAALSFMRWVNTGNVSDQGGVDIVRFALRIPSEKDAPLRRKRDVITRKDTNSLAIRQVESERLVWGLEGDVFYFVGFH